MLKALLNTTVFASTLLIFSLFNSTLAQDKKYQKTSDGVIVFLPTSNHGASAVKLQVVSDKIIHVITSPSKSFTDKSLVVIETPSQPIIWKVIESKGSLSLQTAFINANIQFATGAINFTDKGGRTILQEEVAQKIFIPTTIDGGEICQVRQVFLSSPNEAFYGLGQHQQGIMNYKNENLELAQHNTEVAIPFMVSNKNYGILWDNCSITKFGDGRDYEPLSTLKLYDANGKPGGLTATYYDKSNPSLVYVKQRETVIDYEYLKDMKKFPSVFPLARGNIKWEGSIKSGFTGNHKISVKYAGYIKIWIDGQLLLDRWRQAWNPAVAIVNVKLQLNTKHTIKIEWNPDGGESFLTCKWLSPMPENTKDKFAFCSEAGDNINYYFIYGKNLDDVVGGYRNITGKAGIMPKWAMGLWQSRERYKTQDEILTVAKEFRQKNIPLDNIVMDWQYWKTNEWGSQEFDSARFTSPQGMIDELHRNNMHFMVSVWPKFYTGTPNYELFKNKGWLYPKNVEDNQKDWLGYVSTFYDAFNADARKGFWDLLNKHLYSKGIDAWWLDASEPDIYSNISIPERKQLMMPNALGTSTQYFNAFPLVNAKGIYEGQRAIDSSKRVFILTRSGFSGLQRYASAVWSGDIAARWSDLKNQIPAGINFSLSGIPYWTMDIGGFAVENRFEHPQGQDLIEWRELNTRWYQFGAFCPLFRVHGQFPFREIYNISPEGSDAYKSMLYYDKLRYRLMPYIYSLAGKTYHDNYTIMRGLVMDFADDTAVGNIGNQYMFGPALLVNPVTDFKARQKIVYLPSTTGWFDFYSGKYYKGGQSVTVDAPLDKIPLLVKEGSIIPIGPDMQYTTEIQADTLTLYVYTGKDATFSLYEDENNNYNYEKGKYANIPISYNEKTKSLTIDKRMGEFDGMIKERIFQIVWVDKNNTTGFNNDRKPDALIKYKGDKVLIQK
jgi:alpha-D-xyloside xylohydrolase